MAISLLIAGTLCKILPAKYTSTAFIVVGTKAPDPTEASGGQRDGGPDPIDVENELVILTAPDLARRVVTDLALYEAPATSSMDGVLCTVWPSADCARRATAEPSMESRVGTFTHQLTVKQQSRSRVIELGFTDPDPQRAADAINLLIKLRRDDEISTQVSTLNRTTGWLDDRVSEVRNRLVALEQNIAEFRGKSGLAETTSNGQSSSILTEQLASASTALSEAEARLAAAEARNTVLEKADASGDRQSAIRFLDEPMLLTLSQRIAELQARQAELEPMYGPAYPAVAAVTHQIKEGRVALDAEWAKSVRAVRSQLATSRDEVARLTERFDSIGVHTTRLGPDAARLQGMEQEAAGLRSVYESFLSRDKQLAAQADIVEPTIQVVSPGTPPTTASSPPVARLLAAGAVAGLVLGIGLAVFRDTMARGFDQADRMGAALGVRVLTVFPRLRMPRSKPHNPRLDILDQPYRRPFTLNAERVRTLITAITLSARSESASEAVVVVSSLPGEGKSTICTWLARAAGQPGHRVVLVDADARKLTNNDPVNYAGGEGLTEWLHGKVSLDDIIQEDRVSNVDYIAAGRPLAYPLSNDALSQIRTLIHELKRRYALEDIDTPPIQIVSDALLFARVADQTVFLCRWRTTPRAVASSALALLRSSGAKVSGVAMSVAEFKEPAAYQSSYFRPNVKRLPRRDA